MLLEAFLAAGLALGTPILLAALGELLVERTGVLNIGVEGMMLGGAFAAALCAATTGSVLWGCVAAAVVGMLLGLLFALAAIRLAADQIVVGAAILALTAGRMVGEDHFLRERIPELVNVAPLLPVLSAAAVMVVAAARSREARPLSHYGIAFGCAVAVAVGTVLTGGVH